MKPYSFLMETLNVKGGQVSHKLARRLNFGHSADLGDGRRSDTSTVANSMKDMGDRMRMYGKNRNIIKTLRSAKDEHNEAMRK